MIKNDKKNRMNGRKMTIHPVLFSAIHPDGRKMTIHPVFHSLNLSCSIKECKTVRADITVTDRMEKNQIQMII